LHGEGVYIIPDTIQFQGKDGDDVHGVRLLQGLKPENPPAKHW